MFMLFNVAGTGLEMQTLPVKRLNQKKKKKNLKHQANARQSHLNQVLVPRNPH